MSIVIFDFDGVIIDSFNLAFQLNKVRDAELTAEEYRRRVDGNIYNHIEPSGNPNHSLQSRTFIDFFSRYTPAIMSMEYIRGIDETIRTMAEQHTLCINSSTPAKTIREYLKLHGLNEYFSDVMGPEVDFSKRQKFVDLLNEYSARAENSIFITDTLGDIREAQAEKIVTIGVTWGYHSRETLEKGVPYAIVDTPAELPGIVQRYFSQ